MAESKLDNLGEVIEAEILIIGGGLSGLWAANRAKETIDNVLIVDKGAEIGLSGQGYFSGGGIQAVPPGDNVDDYVKDIIYLGDGLYEQDLLEKILKQSWDRIEDYQRMGVAFIKEKDGRLRYIPQRGLKHNACYLGEPSGSGGQSMMAALAREANKLGVKYLNRIYITNLLKSDGRVVGAVGFNFRSGRFHIFKAKAVIVASGGCSFRGGYEDTQIAWGGGLDMVFRAGAELKNLEFMRIWIIPREFRWEGVTYLLPLGAELVNEAGEHFMNRYSPSLKSNCDYNYIARAMAMETKAGRGPFYLDCSGLSPEHREIMTPEVGWTKLQYDRLLEAGISPFDKRQEWTATPWEASGAHSDLEMRTIVPGLFVAGVLRNMDAGVYLGGWSLCKTAAFGRWAGKSAADYANANALTPINANEIKELKEAIYAPSGREGIVPEEVLVALQKVLFPVLLLKNEAKLKGALNKVEGIRDELLPCMSSEDSHQLAKLNGVRSMVLIAELVLRASLMRTESRASHYREDHPDRDDKNWLKWIIISQKDGKPDLRLKPLPLDRYKHKTWDYYSDKFHFPK